MYWEIQSASAFPFTRRDSLGPESFRTVVHYATDADAALRNE
jgi:hypothetical protein